MNTSHFGIALLTSIAALAFSGTSTSTLANDVAPPVAQAALVQSADPGLEVSAARRAMNTRTGGARTGNVGRVGHTGNVGRVGRVGRIGERVGRVGRFGRYGRIGYRYGRVGRIGYVPVPIPSGPGVLAPVGPGATCPVCPVQACLVAVYADPNLTGLTTETRDNQPRLDLSGWQNQISSIIVKSGTWDFYPDLEFRGQALRLAPGSYGILEPQWTKRIGSFMCVR